MSSTLNDTYQAVVRELTAAGIENAAGDARLLLAHALEIAPDRVLLMLDQAISASALTRLDQSVAARLERKPVSHILGRRNFWGRDFVVTGDVLDPRPETETLIDLALQTPFSRVLDLGTGSGCILLTLLVETPGTTGMGVDISAEALEIAVQNRDALDLARPAIFARSDWFEKVVGQFDLIVANPPYIALPEMAGLQPEVLRWEPMAALTPGVSGLEAYEIIALETDEYLLPGGRVLLETGPKQAAAVSGLFQSAGLELVRVHSDMDGRDRVVELRKRP